MHSITSHKQLIKELIRLEIVDYTSVSGSYVWLPFGQELLNSIGSILNKSTKSYQKIIIPSILSAEDSILEPHSHELLKDSRFSLNDGKYFLKPTSQMILYPYLAKKLKSWKQLPCRVFAVNSTFRRENGVSLGIRCQEISFFYEKHGVFSSEAEVVSEIKMFKSAYTSLFNDLNIPFTVCERYTEDCFPNAIQSIAFDTILAGRSLQIGTIHNLGVNFSVPVKLKFDNKKNTEEFAKICCAGISQRVLTAFVYHNLRLVDGVQTLILPSVLGLSKIVCDKKNYSNEEIMSLVHYCPTAVEDPVKYSGLLSSGIKHSVCRGVRFVLKNHSADVLLVDNYLSTSKKFPSSRAAIDYAVSCQDVVYETVTDFKVYTLDQFMDIELSQGVESDLLKIKLKNAARLDEVDMIKTILSRSSTKIKVLGFDEENYIYLAKKY
jgi:hypothetical protein